MRIPIEVSARHLHLSPKDLEKLFGRGYKLKKLHALSQKGEFAAREEVKIAGKKTNLGVRIVGPARSKTQLEISASDAHRLGIYPAVRLSGDIENTPGFELIGPKGKAEVNRGMIIAKRHLHLNPADAKKLRLGHRHVIKVKTEGEREVIFDKVVVRVGKNFKLSLHIDTDEANAAGLWKKKNYGRWLRS
ncbi:MAG: phosphate propanoyltransferase [Patescibacteria group bacterium]|jgi:putative phosphotransacetylase